MSDQFPVTIAVRRSDGSTEQVRVGTATRTEDGFSLKLGELSIGSSPVRAEAAPARRAAAAPSSGGGGGGGGDGMLLPNYGRSKGQPVYGASMQDLEFYANGARRSLADPGKSRWHDKERVLLAALEAEMARQGGGQGGGDEGGGYGGGSGGGYGGGSGGGSGGGAFGDEPPPHGDDDAPF